MYLCTFPILLQLNYFIHLVAIPGLFFVDERVPFFQVINSSQTPEELFVNIIILMLRTVCLSYLTFCSMFLELCPSNYAFIELRN